MTKVLVVLSGGQDSTTCLYWAKRQWPASELIALTFNYGQRHRREVDAARIIAGMAGAHHITVDVPNILVGASPLVNKKGEVGHYESVAALPGGIEPTFVPARNMLFLTLAANRAAALGAKSIVTGVSQEDYGGYPDCRGEFITLMNQTINSALGADDYVIQTPLLYLSKKETVELAMTLPGCMEALAYSHTCYDGAYPPIPNNHASLLRAKGFYEAGVGDPLIMRAKREGLLPEHYPDHGLLNAPPKPEAVPAPASEVEPAKTVHTMPLKFKKGKSTQ